MRGWLLDCYADIDKDRMVTWFRTGSGTQRTEEAFVPRFYVSAPVARLRKLQKDLPSVRCKGL